MKEQMLFVTFKIGIGMPCDPNLTQKENVLKALQIANEEFSEGVEVTEDDMIGIEFEDVNVIESIEEVFKPKFQVIKGGKFSE